MITAVVKNNHQLPAMAMTEHELMSVLRSSLYLGAKDESIKMAVNYCKAAGLDIMQKPVHLVPMWDSKNSEMRDVVMPGIGLYRTQASRSNEMAGITEPVFGEDVSETIGGVLITYPKSCKVIVKRVLPNGQIADFVGFERWIENYAVKGGKEKSIAPNAMWLKRPYAQLAKCAEAQALRKAFPELGAAPTAEEMEGKEIDVTPTSKPEPAARPILENQLFDKNASKWQASIENGKHTIQTLSAWIEAKGADLSLEQKEIIASWQLKPDEVVIENPEQDIFLSEYEEKDNQNA